MAVKRNLGTSQCRLSTCASECLVPIGVVAIDRGSLQDRREEICFLLSTLAPDRLVSRVKEHWLRPNVLVATLCGFFI